MSNKRIKMKYEFIHNFHCFISKDLNLNYEFLIIFAKLLINPFPYLIYDIILYPSCGLKIIN